MGENLLEEAVPVGGDRVGGVPGFNLIDEGKTQVPFVVPLQQVILLWCEWVADGDGELVGMVEAEHGVVPLRTGLFANRYKLCSGHFCQPLLQTENSTKSMHILKQRNLI